MGLTLKTPSLELTSWMLLAPFYMAGIAFGLTVILSFPSAIELLLNPKHSSEGVGHLFDTLYIWLGVSVMAGGYVFFLTVPPATLTGVAKIVIDRVVKAPKYRKPWIYGVAVPVSTLAWFYYLLVFPRNFSLTGSYWGRPAYAWVAIFVAMGLLCSWMMLRRKSMGQIVTRSGLS